MSAGRAPGAAPGLTMDGTLAGAPRAVFRFGSFYALPNASYSLRLLLYA